MESINNTHTIIKATYCGKSNNSGLRVNHEYKFQLFREFNDGYWRAKCIDKDNDDILMIFSCINAMYENLKNIKMVKSDGSIVAF